MNTVYLAAISASLLVSAAVVPSQATASSSVAEEKKADPDAVRCKDTTVVGSRIPVRVCRTNAEWEAEQRALVEEHRSSRQSSGRCGDASRC
jgi:hypothetical protein